jgi:signal peptide peptidase SppA
MDHAAEILSERASSDNFWPPDDDWRAAYRPYVVRQGVLIIPVKGVLLHDFPWQLGSWATGYDYIWRAFQRGQEDPEVRGIALAIHSPGGEVAGNFDLVDRMYEARGNKPIRAFAMEYAYSAAYSIASVARQIVVSRTGGVGSIGVVTAHLDVSKAMDEYGLKVTFIFAGKHKVDGNAYEPLPDSVKARIQSRINELYRVFVSTVARNRGVDEEKVQGTEALTFTASEAVASGWLADSVGVFEDAMAAFVADLSADEGDEQMTDKTTKTPAELAAEQTTAVTAARADGVTEGTATGAKAEKTRITAIMALPSAQKRREAALKVALTTDMTAEQADGLLTSLPEDVASKAAGGDAFEKAMSKDNPDLGAGSDDDAAKSPAAAILADQRAITGVAAVAK